MDEKVDKILAAITSDINSRSGLGAAWRLVAKDRKLEIMKRWRFLVSSVLEEDSSSKSTTKFSESKSTKTTNRKDS